MHLPDKVAKKGVHTYIFIAIQGFSKENTCKMLMASKENGPEKSTYLQCQMGNPVLN